jgi:hypothetical protein
MVSYRIALSLLLLGSVLLGCGSNNPDNTVVSFFPPGNQPPTPPPSTPLQAITGTWSVVLTTATGAPSLAFTVFLQPEPEEDDDFEGTNLVFQRGGECFPAARVDGHLSQDNTLMVLRVRAQEASGGDEARLEIQARLNSARNSASGSYVIEGRCGNEQGTAVLTER